MGHLGSNRRPLSKNIEALWKIFWQFRRNFCWFWWWLSCLNSFCRYFQISNLTLYDTEYDQTCVAFDATTEIEIFSSTVHKYYVLRWLRADRSNTCSAFALQWFFWILFLISLPINDLIQRSTFAWIRQI